jgi:hypothetical protein
MACTLTERTHHDVTTTQDILTMHELDYVSESRHRYRQSWTVIAHLKTNRYAICDITRVLV